MAILDTDLKYHYTGAVSHEAAQTDGDASLGGYRASSEITTGVDNNVFDDLSFEVEAPAAKEVTGAVEDIGNEDTEPAANTWSDATTKGTGKDCPNASNQVVVDGWFAIWLRRVISASASAQAAETVTMRVEGDTAA